MYLLTDFKINWKNAYVDANFVPPALVPCVLTARYQIVFVTISVDDSIMLGSKGREWSVGLIKALASRTPRDGPLFRELTLPRYEAAFADISALRVALDQDLAEFDAPLEGVREVAFFPPMTGG